MALSPEHGAAVVGGGGRQGFFGGEGQVVGQARDVGHGTVGHGPVRAHLFPHPVAEHRPVSEVVHLAVDVNVHVWNAMLGEVEPQRGAKPVRAVANADKPDSRLVMRDVHVLEKHTALDSAHVAMPSSVSMPRS